MTAPTPVATEDGRVTFGSWTVGRPGADPFAAAKDCEAAYDRFREGFDLLCRFGALRAGDVSGVWTSAAGCVRTYLLLEERAESFRADPAVASAPAASRVPELATPTAADGWEQLLSSADAEGVDPQVAAAREMHHEHLDRLELEHLMGAR